jgi:hypothetical protein
MAGAAQDVEDGLSGCPSPPSCRFEVLSKSLADHLGYAFFAGTTGGTIRSLTPPYVFAPACFAAAFLRSTHDFFIRLLIAFLAAADIVRR